MKCNVGGIDRTARIIIGAVLLGAGFFYRAKYALENCRFRAGWHYVFNRRHPLLSN